MANKTLALLPGMLKKIGIKRIDLISRLGFFSEL